MPIKVPGNLPAKKVMERENIFMIDENRAVTQDIRPLRIAILNLMPIKEDTEVQLLRSLSNTPLQIEVTFLTTATYIGKNTPQSHLDQFYLTYEDVKDERYDGLIITGAPVERMEFNEVAYWEELVRIMDWSHKSVTSTFHICWGAQAAAYYHYGVRMNDLDKKLSGIYAHQVYHRKEPLVRGFDDVFYAPHSRYTGIGKKELEDKGICVLADSEEAGAFIAIARGGRQVFVFGHPEYDRMTLDKEYQRDVGKGLNPEMPKNYYREDDPSNEPLLTWRAHSNALYTNWLNYYVYQVTPYDLFIYNI